MSAQDVIKNVKDGYIMDRPNHCSEDLYQVMKCCWKYDPNSRCNFADLRSRLSRILEVQRGYCIDLQHFPHHLYYNLYESVGEKV